MLHIAPKGFMQSRTVILVSILENGLYLLFPGNNICAVLLYTFGTLCSERNHKVYPVINLIRGFSHVPLVLFLAGCFIFSLSLFLVVILVLIRFYDIQTFLFSQVLVKYNSEQFSLFLSV